jgi:phage-related baseplate assembly protein
MIDIMTIPEPVFVEANWEKIFTELLQAYELAIGKPVSKGQLEAVLLSIFAYRENLLRILINETAKQNLLAYARGEVLDHLGALLGVYRLPATKARTTLRFYFSELDRDILIPKGTKVATKDDKAVFETAEDVSVKAGEQYVDVLALCTEAGTHGNGYFPRQISVLIDPVPYVEKVENISISFGGSDVEDDERFRYRIQLAPESFSNAGSVISPSPGVVKVVVLMKNGQIPSPEILQKVSDTLNDEKVRPLTDRVIVSQPEVIEYSILGTIYLYKNTPFADAILEQAYKVCEDYANLLKNKLGKNIVPEELIKAIQSLSGVYRVVLENPQHTILTDEQVAICQSITLNIAGSVDG